MRIFIYFITLAASSGKHNASVWRPSLRLYVCPIFIQPQSIGHMRRMLNVTYQVAAHDAASVHFRPNITRTEIVV